jgi:tetratricopeptide (TPR) repeat protein
MLLTLLAVATLFWAGRAWSDEATARDEYGQGMNLIATKADWSGAAKYFRRATEQKKDYAEAYNKLGLCYFNQERTLEAVTQFKNAVFLNPRLTEGWYNLGYGLERLHKDEAAVDRYRRAEGVDPAVDPTSLIQVHYRLGMLLKKLALKKAKSEEKPDLAPAIQEMEMAVKMDGDFAEAHHELGRLYDLIGRYPEAIRQFGEAIRNHKDYAEAFTDRGVSYWHDGDWDAALADCRKAVDMAPEFAGGHYNLAELLMARVEVLRSQDKEFVYHEEAEKAIDEYRLASGLDPKNLTYLLALAKAYHEYHDYDHATALYLKVRRMPGQKWNKDVLDALEQMKKEQASFVSHYPKPTPTPEQ